MVGCNPCTFFITGQNSLKPKQLPGCSTLRAPVWFPAAIATAIRTQCSPRCAHTALGVLMPWWSPSFFPFCLCLPSCSRALRRENSCSPALVLGVRPWERVGSVWNAPLAPLASLWGFWSLLLDIGICQWGGDAVSQDHGWLRWEGASGGQLVQPPAQSGTPRAQEAFYHFTCSLLLLLWLWRQEVAAHLN